MISNTDLPHQSHPIQQKPNSFLKLLIWKIAFILLLIINLVFGFWIFEQFYSVYWGPGLKSASQVALITVIIFSVPLAIIDLTALLFYGFKYRPHGRTRVIWGAAFILVCIPLIYAFYGFVILPIVLGF